MQVRTKRGTSPAGLPWSTRRPVMAGAGSRCIRRTAPRACAGQCPVHGPMGRGFAFALFGFGLVLVGFRKPRLVLVGSSSVFVGSGSVYLRVSKRARALARHHITTARYPDNPTRAPCPPFGGEGTSRMPPKAQAWVPYRRHEAGNPPGPPTGTGKQRRAM